MNSETEITRLFWVHDFDINLLLLSRIGSPSEVGHARIPSATFMLRIGGTDPGTTITKVGTSDRNSSISYLLHEYKHVLGHRPRIVMSRSSVAVLHTRDLRLCSKVLPELDKFMFTPTAVGINRAKRQLEIELQLGKVH